MGRSLVSHPPSSTMANWDVVSNKESLLAFMVDMIYVAREWCCMSL